MRTTLALLLVAALAAPATAQTTGFGAHGAVSLPTGDYADGVNTGFAGGLDLWFPIGQSGLSWYTSADAIAHGVDSDGVDGGFLYIPVMTGARFDIPAGPVALFLTGQAGVVMTKGPTFEGVAGTSVANAESKLGASFGFNVGAGLQLTQYVYAGARYFPLGTVEFKYEDNQSFEGDVSFLDIYVGFGVR